MSESDKQEKLARCRLLVVDTRLNRERDRVARRAEKRIRYRKKRQREESVLAETQDIKDRKGFMRQSMIHGTKLTQCSSYTMNEKIICRQIKQWGQPGGSITSRLASRNKRAVDLSTLDKVKISDLKNSKAAEKDGVPVEFRKYGSEQLQQTIQHVLLRV